MVDTLGRVKIDIDKGGRQFEHVNISDLEIVKGLITLRHKIDMYHICDDFHKLEASNWQEINQELVCLYVDLDETIKQCMFSESQIALLKMLMNGYDFLDIQEYIGIPTKKIRRVFNSMCKQILDQGFSNWLVWATYNYIPSKWKTCSKCGESLPLNETFFMARNDSRDGFRSECKKCYINMTNC
jgi:uncharacterized protein YerC